MATFGGYHAKEQSDLLQKKLQEEAAKDDDITESLVKSAAGMNACACAWAVHGRWVSDVRAMCARCVCARCVRDVCASDVRERCACVWAWAVGERYARGRE